MYQDPVQFCNPFLVSTSPQKKPCTKFHCNPPGGFGATSVKLDVVKQECFRFRNIKKTILSESMIYEDNKGFGI